MQPDPHHDPDHDHDPGRLPAGSLPTGPLPTGPLPTGPLPTGPLPTGPLPAGRSWPSRERQGASGLVTIGVDVGGTKVLGAVVDGEVLIRAEHRIETPGTPEEAIDSVIDVVDILFRGATGAGQTVIGVGVGVPGLVDDAGRLHFAPNLPALEGFPVRGALEGGLSRVQRDLRLVVGNDATCAIEGERAVGAAAGLADVVMVTLGTGIGGGILTGGVLLRGAHGYGSEVGHMTVDPDGSLCTCGNHGCWERYASGWALGNLGRNAARAGRAPRLLALASGDAGDVRGEHVTEAAAAGDAGARDIIARWAWWLAAGLANLAAVFDPELIIVGGGLAEAGDVLLGPARAAFAGLFEGGASRPEVPIVPAALGQRSGAAGAAVLARAAGPAQGPAPGPAPGAAAGAAPGAAPGPARRHPGTGDHPFPGGHAPPIRP